MRQEHIPPYQLLMLQLTTQEIGMAHAGGCRARVGAAQPSETVAASLQLKLKSCLMSLTSAWLPAP